MTDLDRLRAEWQAADETGQRDWALEHATELLDEIERLRDSLAGMDGEVESYAETNVALTHALYAARAERDRHAATLQQVRELLLGFQPSRTEEDT